MFCVFMCSVFDEGADMKKFPCFMVHGYVHLCMYVGQGEIYGTKFGLYKFALLLDSKGIVDTLLQIKCRMQP